MLVADFERRIRQQPHEAPRWRYVLVMTSDTHYRGKSTLQVVAGRILHHTRLREPGRLGSHMHHIEARFLRQLGRTAVMLFPLGSFPAERRNNAKFGDERRIRSSCKDTEPLGS